MTSIHARKVVKHEDVEMKI